MKKYVAAALCMFVIAACAAGGMKQSASRPSARPNETGAAPEAGQSVPDHGSPKDELDQLYAQLEQARQQDNVEEAKLDPGPLTIPMAEPARSPKTDPTCKPAPSDTCNTSCTLSGSICKNKDRICELAKDLGDDDSLQKCNKAAKTCKTSADKCCSCML